MRFGKIKNVIFYLKIVKYLILQKIYLRMIYLQAFTVIYLEQHVLQEDKVEDIMPLQPSHIERLKILEKILQIITLLVIIMKKKN